MLKFIHALAIIILASYNSKAQSFEKDTIKMQSVTIFNNSRIEQINWQNISLDEASRKAKADGKNILIYFTAKWCGPCRYMEREVFPKQVAIRAVNDYFIAIKIDIDSWGNKKWSQDFAVRGIPDFFILKDDQERLRHKIGGMNLKNFLDFLNLKLQPVDLKILDVKLGAPRTEKFKNKIAIALGAGFSKIRNLPDDNIFGYDAKLAFNIEKKRFFFSPGISFTSIGSSIDRLNYLRIPLEFGLNVHRGRVLDFPGGIRILGAPYYGRLLNTSISNFTKNDFGLEYGIGVYMGNAAQSSLEFSIKGVSGFTDVMPTLSGFQRNQFFKAGLTIAITKG